MINNSALSSSMNVADIVPKAATKQQEPRQGDNAFGEALAGAHTVHDRRESQAAGNVRRDTTQADRTSDRTRGQDRTGDAPAPRTDRAERPAHAAGDDRDATASNAADSTTGPTATTTATARDTSATTTSTDEASDATATTTTEADTGVTDAIGSAAAQVTVAVAAAPVVADLDAIIVPTSTTVTQVATDAVDAANRLAIAVDAPVTTTTDAATTTVDAPIVASTTATTDDEAVVDVQLATAAIAPGAEDAETGDVQAGPKRPTTSTPITTSGPSPTQLAAATFATTDDDAPTTTVHQVAQQVAAADAIDVAAGTTTDAAATQLVQAVAVEADDAPSTDAEVVVADDAAALVKASKDDAAATKVAADPEVVSDADEPEVVQAARLNQGQAPTVAVNAQVQAKAAEQAAEEGGDAAAAPAKLEPLPTQLAPTTNAARGDGAAAALRMREGLQAQVQERIDHIAEQLATRLRLSQAAGGSHVQLSLKPRELGEVTVQMNVRDGAVAATILVDKADTLRTLQTNIEDLKRSLEAQGLSIGEFSVDVRGESGAGGANARAAADLRGNATRTSSGSSPTLAGAAAVTPGLSGDREVDPEDVHDGDVSVLA